MKIFNKIFAHIRSHLWVELISEIIIIFLVIIVIFQLTFRSGYGSYMLEETKQSETTALNAIADNLDWTIKNAVNISGEIAISDNIKTAAEKVRDSSPADFSRYGLSLMSELSSAMLYSGNILFISIADESGLLYDYCRYWGSGLDTDLWNGDRRTLLDDLYSQTLTRISNQEIRKYTIAIDTDPSTTPNKVQLMHIAFPLLGGDSVYRNTDLVVIVSFMLKGILNNTNFFDNSSDSNRLIYLSDQDGTILYHEDTSVIGSSQDNLISDTDIHLVKELDEFPFNVNSLIDTSVISHHLDRFYYQSVFICIIFLAAACVCSQLLIRWLLKPVFLIRDTMARRKESRETVLVDVQGSNELWQLGDQYNDMIQALEEQELETQHQYEEKMHSMELQSIAERQALESQINAHFLCNTLNAINYDVMESGNYEVSNLLKTLSSMLQYTFSRHAQNVTIGAEMQCADQYLYLQKYRRMDLFDYSVSFPKEYSEWPCCKLVLQPFVENSIIHGFDGMERGGLITIKGYEEGGYFIVSIEDNGCGMDEEFKNRLLANLMENSALSVPANSLENTGGNGIGLQNVVTRMRMFFGERFEMKLETAPGQGTCFTFRLPLSEPKEEDIEDEDIDC